MHERADRVRVENGQKRVRAYLGGYLVADTIRPVLVWEHPYYPAYYVPAGDVRADLNPTGDAAHDEHRGRAAVCDVVLADQVAAAAAVRYDEPALDSL
ncbi:MAG: DUF427 domain-containing protein, partial [Alphaproteobacteria bacterium]|nr:DUF427 domain-containing protein [Alphaproteobacteria bacterium]